MTKVWLTGINQSRMVFSELPIPEDKQVSEALTVLRSSEGDNTGMGFHKLGSVVQAMDKVKRVLAEHNLELNDSQLAQLIKHKKELDALKRAQARFWMQVSLSVLLVAAALVFLGFGNPSDASAKSVFGLLGSVVGYWLR